MSKTMRVNYKNADGHIIHIKVTDEVGRFYISSMEYERKNDRRETRRHTLLSTFLYECAQFFDSGINICEEVALRDAVNRVMDKLSSREHFLITAICIDDRTCTEIANTEGKAVSTITRETKKAKDKFMRLYLKDN